MNSASDPKLMYNYKIQQVPVEKHKRGKKVFKTSKITSNPFQFMFWKHLYLFIYFHRHDHLVN